MGETAYKRCTKGVCDETTPNPSVKTGGNPKDPEDLFYQCVSNTKTPCPPTGSACKCFIVVEKRGKDVADDQSKGEVTFPAAPDPSAKDPYKGMLSKAKADKNYPRRTKDWKNDYWIIRCSCLEVDESGDPVAAE